MDTKLKIQCGQCSYEYFVYAGNSLENPKSLNCPSCYSEMEHQMKDKVWHVASTVDDLNRDFRKYVEERREPLFQVTFEPIPMRHKFQQKRDKE